MYRILILNENVEDRSVLFDALQEFDEEFELYEAKKSDEVMRIIHNKKVQIVISDFSVKVYEIYASNPEMELLLISSLEEAAEWEQRIFTENIKYIVKPLDKKKLKQSLTEAIRHIVKKEVEGHVWEVETSTETRAIEKKVSIDKEDTLIREIGNVIALRNETLLREKLEKALRTYREMEEQYPFYVRSMCMTILQSFVKVVPSKMSELEKMSEYIFRTEEYDKIENLLRAHLEMVVDEFESEASSSNRVIYQIKQYINLHYYEDLKLSHLAEQVYLSSNYLSNVFTKHTGYSLNKYIKEVRLAKAQELLLTTNMKIADIGRRVGYDNTSYFIKKFQEKYGMTPEKYRLKPIE